MNTDNSHAESRILNRTIAQYDQRRAWFPEESESIVRDMAINYLSQTARLDYCDAAIVLADALARRAANKLSGENNGTP